MNCVLIITVVFTILISVSLYFVNYPIIHLCALETCPYCYGTDFCKEFKSNAIKLKFSSFSDFVFNLFSVKNVYFAEIEGISVVIKKLAYNSDLDNLNEDILSLGNRTITLNDIEILLNRSNSNFQLCDNDTIKEFLKKLRKKKLANIWTILKVSMEPILLETFNKGNSGPVPHLYGYCGRTIVVENCGIPLNDIETLDWYHRAYVAFQLLEAAEKFTYGHADFRLYLTDISPDNIVVNPKNFAISFIDLGNGILQKKIIPETNMHATYHMETEDYAYSKEEICGSHISDHNIYAVCRILLSQDAPWPMMKLGLLHSPPSVFKDSDLFKHVELCVSSKTGLSRFQLSTKIKNSLKMSLTGKYVLN